MRRILWFLILIGIFPLFVYSQNFDYDKQSNPFYFDAVVFKGDTSVSNVDIYALIPYEMLIFNNKSNKYVAKFELYVQVNDSLSNKVTDFKIEKTVVLDNYETSQGGPNSFVKLYKRITLNEGLFKIKASLLDNNSSRTFERNRVVSVIDFNKFDKSLSGLLLLSSIEEVNGKYKITPHLSDNVGNLNDGFFAFFEIYKKGDEPDSVDFAWEIANMDDELQIHGDRKRFYLNSPRTQIFLHVPKSEKISTGSFLFKVLALKPSNSLAYDETHYQAISARPVIYLQTIGGNVLTNLDKAIKQLRFIAFSSELDEIEDAKTESDKQKRFEEFWKKHDPTPGTERNEAFDEYYSRVDHANKAFKSYYEGWLSDQGMIFIIFGPPINMEKLSNYGDGRQYERWYYNNREFIFVDNSGFGDYRLIRPAIVNEKYTYKP